MRGAKRGGADQTPGTPDKTRKTADRQLGTKEPAPQQLPPEINPPDESPLDYMLRVMRAEDIARAVWRLISDADRRRDMRAASLNTIDGRAGERIAQDLADAVATARASRTAAAQA